MTSEEFFGLFNYWVVVFLMMTGFYIVIAQRNLVKSILGLNIFQTSVFLLYITMGKIRGATAPVIPPELVASHDSSGHGEAAQSESAHGELAHGELSNADVVSESAGHLADHHPVVEAATSYQTLTGIEPDAVLYSNPLPSVLMLTAIVVGIATTSLALALIVRIKEEYGTIDEDEILQMDRVS